MNVTKLGFPEYIKLLSLDFGYRDDIYKTKNADGTFIYTKEAKLIEALSQILHFSYQIKHSKENTIGINLGDGNWSGEIGMLQRGESDLIVDSLTITNERQEVVDFSYPYYLDNEIFVTNKPEPVQKAFVIFYPFSYMVWILLFTFLLVFCLVVSMHNRNVWKIRIFLILYGNIFGQSLPGKFKNLRTRLLFYIWIIGVMFLSYAYQATLLSYLTFPLMTGVRNIAELSEAVKKGSHICRTYKSSYLIQTLMSSDDDKFKTIGESLMKHSVPYINAERAIESSTKNVAFLFTRSPLSIYERKYYLSKDSFHTSCFGVAVRKGFCCMRALDKAILRIWETGIYQKIQRERKAFHIIKDNWTAPQIEHELYLRDTVGTFAMLIIGHTLATIIFILEIISEKIMC